MLQYDLLACHNEQHILKENHLLHLNIGVVGYLLQPLLMVTKAYQRKTLH